MKRLALIVLLLAAVGCGRGQTHTAKKASGSKVARVESSPTSRTEAAPQAAMQTSGTAEAHDDATPPAPAATFKPEAAKSNARRVDPKITLASPCVVRLGKQTVNVHALPLSDISYALSFADGRNYDMYGIGQANENGDFAWSFAIPADAATGKATVLVAASSSKGGGGSTASFQVAAAC